MPLIYNCYAPLRKHTVLEYGISKPKPAFKATITAGAFVSRHSRRAKNCCWFLGIHVSWKIQDSKFLSVSFLTWELVSGVSNSCFISLYQGTWLILFMVLVTIFFLFFLIIWHELKPILKPLLDWDSFLSILLLLHSRGFPWGS